MMNDLIFIIRAISGNGWNTSIKSILPYKYKKEYSTLLGDIGLFFIADIYILKNKGILFSKIDELNINNEDKIQLNIILEEKVNKLLKIEEKKSYSSMFILTLIGIIFVLSFFINNYSGKISAKKRELEEINELIKKSERDYKNLGIGLEHIKKELKKCPS